MVDFGINVDLPLPSEHGLRFGYQIMALTNLALAERQITFLNLNPAIMNQDHGLYFQGVTPVSNSPGSTPDHAPPLRGCADSIDRSRPPCQIAFAAVAWGEWINYLGSPWEKSAWTHRGDRG